MLRRPAGPASAFDENDVSSLFAVLFDMLRELQWIRELPEEDGGAEETENASDDP